MLGQRSAQIAEGALVYGTVWIAVAGWFAGSIARELARSTESESLFRTYRRCWLAAAVMLCVHIAASYGFVHHWSHAAALKATAQESLAVTGVAAAWGVYVNFVFAAVWLGYSAAMFRVGRPIVRVDSFVFGFTAMIVASATVLFESGIVRYLAAIGFLLLAGLRCKRLSTRS